MEKTAKPPHHRRPRSLPQPPANPQSKIPPPSGSLRRSPVGVGRRPDRSPLALPGATWAPGWFLAGVAVAPRSGGTAGRRRQPIQGGLWFFRAWGGEPGDGGCGGKGMALNPLPPAYLDESTAFLGGWALRAPPAASWPSDGSLAVWCPLRPARANVGGARCLPDRARSALASPLRTLSKGEATKDVGEVVDRGRSAPARP